MFLLKLTLYTCAFYFAIALPIIIAELILESRIIFGVHFHGRTGIAVFAAFWGIAWLASFLLALRAGFPFVWAKLVG